MQLQPSFSESVLYLTWASVSFHSQDLVQCWLLARVVFVEELFFIWLEFKVAEEGLEVP